MALTADAQTAEPGQLDASPTLFTVMAAINSAGYSADLSSTNNHPLRDAVRGELAKQNVPSLAGLKSFFERHRKRTDAQELSQYVSFALTAGGQGPRAAFALAAGETLVGIAWLWRLPSITIGE